MSFNEPIGLIHDGHHVGFQIVMEFIFCNNFISLIAFNILTFYSAGFFCTSQVIVLLTQKVSQTLVKANLRPKKISV